MNYDNNFTNDFTSSLQFMQDTDMLLEDDKILKDEKKEKEKVRENKIQSGIDQPDSTIPQEGDFPLAVEDYKRKTNNLLNQSNYEAKDSDNYWYLVLDDLYDLSINKSTMDRLNEFPDEQYHVLQTAFKFAPGSTEGDYQYRDRSVEKNRSEKIEFTLIENGKESNPVYKIEFLEGDEKPTLKITYLFNKSNFKELENEKYEKERKASSILKAYLLDDQKYFDEDGRSLVPTNTVDDTYPSNDGTIESGKRQNSFMTAKKNRNIKLKLLNYLGNIEHQFKYDKTSNEKSVDESIEADGTMFHLKLKLSHGDNKKVDIETFELSYLGPVSDIIKYESEQKENKKTRENYEIEKFYRENPKIVNKIDFYGLQEIEDLKERIVVMEEAKKLVFGYSYTVDGDLVELPPERDTHIDTEIDVYEKTDVYEKYNQRNTLLYSFTIGREENGVIPVKVERLGEKEVDSKDDLTKILIEKIHGYSSSFTPEELKKWLEDRYESLEGKLISNDKEEIIQKAENIISEDSQDPSWFETNYNMTVVQLSDDNIDFFKDRLKDGKYHKNIEGIKDFSKEELTLIELSLQKMSKKTLEMLAGIDFVRINKLIVDKELDKDGIVDEAAGIASREIKQDKKGQYNPYTAIYLTDSALKSGGIVGEVEKISSQVLWTKTHEMGHAFAYNLIKPKMPVKSDESIKNLKERGKVTIDDEFHNFLLKIEKEYGYSVPGVTQYARDYAEKSKEVNKNKPNEKQPYIEYFAETFALYHLDPEFLKTNRPAVYAWFDYVLIKGEAPDWNSIIIEDEGVINREPRTFKDIAKEEVDLFRHLDKNQ